MITSILGLSADISYARPLSGAALFLALTFTCSSLAESGRHDT